MKNKEIFRLLAGFRRFREKYYLAENSPYDRLALGQAPKTLIIGCSDSRVDPAIISSASPGELFVIRNVANLVPPFERGGGFHGVSAAIEFAVVNLKVEHVVVLGHRQCGGIRALMSDDQQNTSRFVGPWMSIAQVAKDNVLARHSKPESAAVDPDRLCRDCEMESIAVSLDNLKTFPFVQEAIDQRGLELHGVYFDLESGELSEYDSAKKEFRNLTV